MDTDVAVKLVTFDEFMAFIERPENDEGLFELIHGRIIEKSTGEEYSLTGEIIKKKISEPSVIKSDAILPSIVIEVKSPTNTIKELREKADYYLANGAQLVWLVFPEKKMVEVYVAGQDVQLFLEDDVLSGGVLPGFTLAVKTIFEV